MWWGEGGRGVEGVEDPPPVIRQKRSKKVQFFTLALSQGRQSTKKTPHSKLLATGLEITLG